MVIEAQDENASSWFKLLVGFGPTLLLIAAFVLLARRAAASGSSGMFSLSRSGAKRYSEDQPKVTFDDVAGIDEAENELVEIVDFLKSPAKYQRLGGTMPKGVLLIGAHGTGKTLLARAIAGQAGVPFSSRRRTRACRRPSSISRTARRPPRRSTQRSAASSRNATVTPRAC